MIVYLFVVLITIGSSLLANNTVGKSFYLTPAPFRSAAPESVTLGHSNLLTDRTIRSQWQVRVYGESSVDPEKFATYFLPQAKGTNKNILVAGGLGSKPVLNGTADLIAHYFGVSVASFESNNPSDKFVRDPYTFHSELTFRPKYDRAGVQLGYHYHLSRDLDRGYWFDIVVPIETMRTDMRLEEKIITPTETINPPAEFVGSMTAAFKQSSWQYGKIDGKQTRTGVGDIAVRFGYVYAKERRYFLNTYLGVSASPMSQLEAGYLFEPTLGSNGHVGFTTGASAGVRLWAHCDTALYWLINTAGTFYVNNTQTRSFDLKGRPWSRYMWLYRSTTDAGTETSSQNGVVPGINSFTQPVNVSLGSTRDLATAFLFQVGSLQLEAGYHFFGRSAEEVRLADTWKEVVGIAAIAGTPADSSEVIAGTSLIYKQTPAATKNSATMDKYYFVSNDRDSDGDDVFQKIVESDLDLASAAHPAVLAHSFYASLRYHVGDTAHPLALGLGVAAQTAHDNTLATNLSGWFEVALQF